MSKLREADRPTASAGRAGAPPASPERKLALSGLAQRALVSFNERSQQRRMLINVLILAQALLLVASAPAYLGARPSVASLAALGVGLLVCLCASLFNQVFQNPVRAAYILVIGGCLAALVQLYLVAFTGTALDVSPAALPLVAIILEAGLLFAPEVTLFIAAIALTLTIVALLLALALGPNPPLRQIYGIVVNTLGLLTVSGLIAWLVSQFIYDSAVEAQRAQELQFAQARLDALVAQTSEQHQRLQSAIAALQQTIGRAINDELTARAQVPDGPLAVVAASLNMLLERMDALTQGEVVRQRMEAAALPLIDVVGRVAEGMTPPPASLPVMTDTPLDNVSVAVSQMQASVTRRLVRVQELSGEVAGALAHSQSGLSTTAQAASEALRTVGASVAAADGLLTAAQREVELSTRARRTLGSLRPGDAKSLGLASGEAHEAAGLGAAEAAALLGLGPDLGFGAPGLTGTFPVMDMAEAAAQEAEGEAVAPSEPAQSPTEQADEDPGASGAPATGGKRPRGAKTGSANGAARSEEPPAELVELSRLLEQLHEEAVKQERSATTLTHELGIVNRNVRGLDIGVAWARQALEAVRRNAEKLHQVAGGTSAVPAPGDAAPNSMPLPADMPPRAPVATRPLAEGFVLPSGGPAVDMPPPEGLGQAEQGKIDGADLVSPASLGEAALDIAPGTQTDEQGTTRGPASGRQHRHGHAPGNPPDTASGADSGGAGDAHDAHRP